MSYFTFIAREDDPRTYDLNLKWQGRECCINLYVWVVYIYIKKDNLLKKLS